VTHCANGQICLDQFNSGAFDLCILDIMLPKIDGFELASAIRKANRTSRLFSSRPKRSRKTASKACVWAPMITS
jgi:CheY-like chemotaxis protein